MDEYSFYDNGYGKRHVLPSAEVERESKRRLGWFGENRLRLIVGFRELGFSIEDIVVKGSVAKGQAGSHSDLDLTILTAPGKKFDAISFRDAVPTLMERLEVSPEFRIDFTQSVLGAKSNNELINDSAFGLGVVRRPEKMLFEVRDLTPLSAELIFEGPISTSMSDVLKNFG